VTASPTFTLTELTGQLVDGLFAEQIQGCGFEGDLVAQGLEFADVVAGPAVEVDAGFVVVGSEVDEPGVVVGEQMPDDHQDGPANGDDRPLLAAAVGDPPVPFTQECVGAADPDGGLAERPGQVPVAFAGAAVALLPAGGFRDPGGEPGPRRQVRGGGEPGHVQADLGDDRRVLRLARLEQLRHPRQAAGDVARLGALGRDTGDHVTGLHLGAGVFPPHVKWNFLLWHLMNFPRLSPVMPVMPGMNRDQLRAVQAPLKERYENEAGAALVTLKASGTLGEGISCSVDTGRAMAEAGLHPASGGDGSLLCSGDMLLEALAACAGVTLRAVATSLGIAVETGTVRAEGDLDFRGTLAVDHDTAVGFRAIRLDFELETEASEEELATLLKLTERYCVVLQTLAASPELTASVSTA